MFGSIGMPELILIFIVALLVFGPKKLPEIGKSLGKGLAEFKRASDELKKTIETEIEQGKAEASSIRDHLNEVKGGIVVPHTTAEREAAPVEAPPIEASATPAAVPDSRPIEPS